MCEQVDVASRVLAHVLRRAGSKANESLPAELGSTLAHDAHVTPSPAAQGSGRDPRVNPAARFRFRSRAIRTSGPPLTVPLKEEVLGMLITNRDSRTRNTRDLSVSLRSAGRPYGPGGILNLCEGGMLISSASDLAVGDIARVELSGPAFRYCGCARVVHCDGAVIGLRFLSWKGPVGRCIRTLVAARLRGEQLDASAIDRTTMWASVERDRIALGVPAVMIEQSLPAPLAVTGAGRD